ncbi:hypothetical protein PF007_g14052, partial [Phytophthora fragariae]
MSSCRRPIKEVAEEEQATAEADVEVAEPVVEETAIVVEVAEEVDAVESADPVVVAAVVESEEAKGQQEQATAEADVEVAEPVVEETIIVVEVAEEVDAVESAELSSWLRWSSPRKQRGSRS